MSFGICFKRETKGWMQDQWSWLASNFGITEIWQRNGGDHDARIYQHTVDIATAAELPVDRPLVVFAPPEGRFIKGDQPLENFVHPDNAIYLFGANMENLTDEDDLGGRVPDSLVYIPTIKHETYGHAVAYMAFWDRYTKRGGHG